MSSRDLQPAKRDSFGARDSAGAGSDHIGLSADQAAFGGLGLGLSEVLHRLFPQLQVLDLCCLRLARVFLLAGLTHVRFSLPMVYTPGGAAPVAGAAASSWPQSHRSWRPPHSLPQPAARVS